MANILLRATKGSSLTIAETDQNWSNLNTSKLEVSDFTGANILSRLLLVDGAGSGLDADTLDGLQHTNVNTALTLVSRDASGNFSANIISADLIGNVTGDVTGNLTGNITGNAASANNALSLGGVAASSYALLASPSLTGTPTAPTAAAGTNTTQLATTAFVRTAVLNATGSLGTMSTQNANSVAITGGTITGTTINGLTVGTNATGTKTISTATPSGGVDGDIWYQV